MRDGDNIIVGNITLRAMHTPGHTPEHLSFLVTDGAQADEPGYMLSGDFVFVGDLGRPDLLDEAAGGVDTRFEGARQLFTSLRDKLPDPSRLRAGAARRTVPAVRAARRSARSRPRPSATSAPSRGGLPTSPPTTSRASSMPSSTGSPTRTPTSPA